MKNWLRVVASLIILAILIYVFRDELDFLREGFSGFLIPIRPR